MVRKIEDTCQLEICCFDLESVLLAEAEGITAIELCTHYEEGGLWPGVQLIQDARKVFSGELRVMIRPRPGDFIYSDVELERCCQQITEAREARADGITFGCLTNENMFDRTQVEKIIGHASAGLAITFHRAFDQVDDPLSLLKDLAKCGVVRVLSSGGKGAARDNLEQLSAFQKSVEADIAIVAAGSVRPSDILQMRAVGIHHFHSSASMRSDGRADPLIVQQLMKACYQPL